MNREQTIAFNALQRVLHCLLKQTPRLPRRIPAWTSAEKLGYPDLRYCVLSENILLTVHKADLIDACHPEKNTFPASLQAIGYAMPHRPILNGLCPLTSFFRAGNNGLWHAALRLTHEPLPFVCALSLNNAFLKGDPKTTAFRLSPFALCVSLEQLPDTSEPPGTEHYTLRGLGLPDVPALAAYTSVIENTHTNHDLCGYPIHTLWLRSEPPHRPTAFLWRLSVPDCALPPGTHLRIGDAIRGYAFLFGQVTLPSKKDSVHFGTLPVLEAVGAPSRPPSLGALPNGRLLDAQPAAPFPVIDYRDDRTADTLHIRGGFVSYATYRDLLPASLIRRPIPSDSDLNRLMSELCCRYNLPKTSAPFRDADLSVIRSAWVHPESGNQYLWILLPDECSDANHRPSYLAVALRSDRKLLYYTVHDGCSAVTPDRLPIYSSWNSRRRRSTFYRHPDALIAALPTLLPNDGIVLEGDIFCSVFQAFITHVGTDGTPVFRAEWKIHDSLWFFRNDSCSPESVARMIRAVCQHGITAVQTLTDWQHAGPYSN